MEVSLDGEGAELEDEEDTPTGEELEEEDTPPVGDGQDAGDQSDAYASLSDRREVIFERYVEGSRPQNRRASNAGNTAQTETNIGSSSSSQPNTQSLASGVIPQLFPTELQGNPQGFPQGIPTAAQGNSRGGFPQGVAQGFPTKYQSQTLMETGREQVRTSRWLNDDQGTLSQAIQLEHALESSSSGSSTPDPCGSSAMAEASRSATEDLATLAAHTRHMLESLSKDTRDFEVDGQPSPKRRRITHTDPGLLNLGMDPTRSISPSVGPNGTSTPRDSPVIFSSPGISGISPRNKSEMPSTNPAAAAVKRNLLDPFSFLSAQRGEPSQTIGSRHHSAPSSTSNLQNQNRTKRSSATVMFSHKKLEVEIPEISSDTRPPIRHHPTHSVNVPYMLVAGQHSPYANRSASSTVTDSRSVPSAMGCPSTQLDPTDSHTVNERAQHMTAQHMTSDPENRTGSSRQHSSTRQSRNKGEGSNKNTVTFQTKDASVHDLELNPTNPGSETSENDLLHGLDMGDDSDPDY